MAVNGRQQSYISALEKERNDLRKSHEAAQQFMNMPKQLGIADDELKSGLSLIANWKKDPLATLKILVDELKGNGYPVEDVLAGKAAAYPGGINPNSISELIQRELQKALGPQIAQQGNTQRETEATQRATQEYNGFLAKHPHADQHEDVLVNMMQKDTSLSPEIAYYKLQTYAATQGLDFSKPLRPQIEGKSVTNTQQPPMERKPIMNGRGSERNVTDSPIVHSADDFSEDIVKQAMREAGMDVSKI